MRSRAIQSATQAELPPHRSFAPAHPPTHPELIPSFPPSHASQAYLGDKSGQSTVPSIWINGEFVGGNSDLQTKNSNGELKKLLAQ